MLGTVAGIVGIKWDITMEIHAAVWVSNTSVNRKHH